MRSSWLALAAGSLLACSGTTGPAGPQGPMGTKGDQGAKGDPGASPTVNVLAMGNTDCPTGGIEIVSSDGRRVICNGARGADGMAGMMGTAGMDGTNGTNGSNGTSVTVAAEMAGTNCPAGGLMITSATGTSYVCNGTNGTNGTGGSANVGRLPDGGTSPGSFVVALDDGGTALSPLAKAAPGYFQFPNGQNTVIGMDTVAFGGTNLTIRAGGTTGMGGAAGGGILELRAGNSNFSGASSCFGCDVNTAGACPGANGNSLRLYAGDNAVGQGFLCNDTTNGDIEFYAGNTQPLRMVVNGNSGNVGIGVAFPTSKLHVAGNVLANNVAVPSDARLKQDIKTIDRAGELLKQLRGVRYRWTPAARARLSTDDKLTMGLLAQDVQRVMPEAVFPMPDGTLTVSYEKVVPVLVEAIKAQDSRIQQLEATERRLEALETRLRKLEKQ